MIVWLFFWQVEARLLKQTPQTMREVMAAKAAAVEATGSATCLLPVQFSACFSSVSAIAGRHFPADSAPRDKYRLVWLATVVHAEIVFRG